MSFWRTISPVAWFVLIFTEIQVARCSVAMSACPINCVTPWCYIWLCKSSEFSPRVSEMVPKWVILSVSPHADFTRSLEIFSGSAASLGNYVEIPHWRNPKIAKENWVGPRAAPSPTRFFSRFLHRSQSWNGAKKTCPKIRKSAP